MLAAEVSDLAERRFAELSVGQQQRVALARAIAQLTPIQHGKVLLADEPIAAMDPEHALATCERLRTLGAQGLCVVAVLHDLTMAMRLADRVIVLAPGGTLAGVSPPSEALALDGLERVFHTRFSRAQTSGGPVIVAEHRLGDTSAPQPGI
jgi:iron complex transport system ATP-binding protein